MGVKARVARFDVVRNLFNFGWGLVIEIVGVVVDVWGLSTGNVAILGVWEAESSDVGLGFSAVAAWIGLNVDRSRRVATTVLMGILVFKARVNTVVRLRSPVYAIGHLFGLNIWTVIRKALLGVLGRFKRSIISLVVDLSVSTRHSSNVFSLAADHLTLLIGIIIIWC